MNIEVPDQPTLRRRADGNWDVIMNAVSALEIKLPGETLTLDGSGEKMFVSEYRAGEAAFEWWSGRVQNALREQFKPKVEKPADGDRFEDAAPNGGGK